MNTSIKEYKSLLNVAFLLAIAIRAVLVKSSAPLEVVARGGLQENISETFSQNSQGNTCTRVFFFPAGDLQRH